MYMKMLRNFPKKSKGRHYCQGLGEKHNEEQHNEEQPVVEISKRIFIELN